MLKQLRPALVMLTLFTVLTGLLYPLAMTGFGQAVFPRQADGSPVVIEGVTVGSRLIGQAFSRPEYFWGRPSAAGAGYDARSSSGSNLGPSSQALADRVRAEVERHGVPASGIPVDLLTASASGLDPHISPAAARFQIARVASARGLQAQAVASLVDAAVETSSLVFVGESRVNVLELNLALDAMDSSQGEAP
ncbi:MAG: potassium-transporting ATPase subunit KdpC [Alphaproteobacteria bacterium]|nr:potassium-transporting ATPase subunit KdpC [Alphaproteobacteria bacterium]